MDGCTKNPSNSFAKAVLFFLFFFATFSFAVAQGKWVLVDKTLESNNKYWKADKNKFYWHNGSVYFLFDDPLQQYYLDRRMTSSSRTHWFLTTFKTAEEMTGPQAELGKCMAIFTGQTEQVRFSK